MNPPTETSDPALGRSNLYTAWGLTIQSELALTPMLEAPDSAPPDVIVRVGKAAPPANRPAANEWTSTTSHERVRLEVDGIASFDVSNGNLVTIEAAVGAAERDVLAYVLGSVLGAVLYQRGFLVLHAAGFRTNDGVVLLAGESGAGKSTLLGEFLRRGYDMVVDDIAALSTGDGDQVLVHPGFPRTRLWADAADALEIKTENLNRVLSHAQKYEREVTSQFDARTAPLTRMYLLDEPEPISAVRRTNLTGMQAFEAVLNNEYRGMAAEHIERTATQFKLAGQLAAQVPIVALTRPDTGRTTEALADLIEHDVHAT